MNVAIIPARGGSTRIPKKNIRPFLGVPVIEYPIKTAIRSGIFDAVVVSTDHVEIAAIARGVDALVHPRPAELAEDGVGTQEVVRRTLLDLYPNGRGLPRYTCCIYPVTPNLLVSDLALAHRYMNEFPDRSYVYVDGIFYFGRTTAFIDDVPLDDPAFSTKLSGDPRWIDVNVEADWREAEEIYLRRHR